MKNENEEENQMEKIIQDTGKLVLCDLIFDNYIDPPFVVSIDNVFFSQRL